METWFNKSHCLEIASLREEKWNLAQHFQNSDQQTTCRARKSS